MKTIAVVLPNPSKSLIGWSDIYYRLKYLEKDYKLIILTRNPDNVRNKVTANIIKIPGKSKIFDYYRFLINTRKLLSKLKYDLLFLATPSVSPLAVNKPVVCYGNIHPMQIVGLDVKPNLDYKIKHPFKYMNKQLKLSLIYQGLRSANIVLAISRQLKDVYLSKGVKNLTVLPMGVDLKVFSKVHKSNPKFIAIYPGSLDKERGLFTMLYGMKEVIKYSKDIKLLLIGVMKDDIRKLVKNIGIQKYVKCLNPVDHNKIAKYLNSASVGISLLSPTVYYRASPPTKIFEYLGCGLPVIANKIPTHTDYIKDNYNGIIIGNDAKSFAAAVFKLHRDKSLYNKLSRNAISSSRKYSLKEILHKFKNEIENFSK
jgi:glycosyltransferase involved in cell wall biosynthesis